MAPKRKASQRGSRGGEKKSAPVVENVVAPVPVVLPPAAVGAGVAALAAGAEADPQVGWPPVGAPFVGAVAMAVDHGLGLGEARQAPVEKIDWKDGLDLQRVLCWQACPRKNGVAVFSSDGICAVRECERAEGPS
jgi:hypothetical protein